MKLESEYETMRAERDVALAEVDRLNEEAASLASQLAAQAAANATLRAQYASSVRTYQDVRAAYRTIRAESIPCGRTDDHEPHLWSDAGPDYQCPGYRD